MTTFELEARKNELLRLITDSIKWPHLGQIDSSFPVPSGEIRSIVILEGLYKIFYYIEDKYLVVLRLWNCHQDPKRLKL